MFEQLETRAVEKGDLVERVKELAGDGFRLIQLHCVKTAEETFLVYSLEKSDFEFVNLRVPVTDGEDGETIPSISGVFPYASLYENETNELFGLKITGMAIDFKGTFYETAKPHIFAEKEAR